MNEEPVHIEVTIGAPIDAVWRALRDTDELRRWHGWHDPGLDAEIADIYHTDVVESADEHWLQVHGGDRFDLTDLGDGRTHLRVTRVPRGSDPEWDAYYEDIVEGWTTFVHQLKFALERQPGADRRTVFLSGAGPDILTATGLAGVGDGRYAVSTPIEALRGEVFFRSDHQLGVTVDAWGLLVVGAQPVTEARPKGGSMAVLSTYGLTDDEFSRLETRWRTWWAGQYG